MHGRPRRPPCISFQYCIFQKKRIDDECTLPPLSSSILIISSCLLLHSAFGNKKMTTGPRFPDVCRQSSIFFAIFSLIKVRFRSKNHFFSSDFPVSKTSFRLFSRHWALIYPTAAGKLTTKPRGRAFRCQFLLLFRKRRGLEAARRIFLVQSQRNQWLSRFACTKAAVDFEPRGAFSWCKTYAINGFPGLLAPKPPPISSRAVHFLGARPT